MILKNKDNIYRISISIILGLLGFIVNFQTIIFPFGEYTAAILIGLLFPMLITLSWGWKYGLLSALVGGCQSMWWLWVPSNGYAIFLIVPPFTLWVVWHGIFAELRRKQKTHKWWLSMYIVEIPFRILSSINLLTLSRWAITFNPPSWNWASNAPNTIPMHFSIFVTIKQAAVAFVVLLLADVLLNISHIRIFFKLKEYIDNRKTGYIISTFLLLGCLFWLLDSVFYAFVFHKESSFIDLLALDIPNYNIFTRTVFFISCLVCGLITSKILRRQREGVHALRENKEELSQIIYGNSIATFVINKEHMVTHWNKAAENLTGVTAKEMIGTKNQWKAFYPEERPVMADILVNELPDKEINKYYLDKFRRSSLIEGVFEAEDFFPDIGEKGKWLFCSAISLKAQNGNIIGAIETLQDITERRQAEAEREKLEQQLRQRQKLESIGTLAGGVAHEINNPITGIMNYAQLISDRLEETSPLKEFSGEIIKESERVSVIVRNLLAFSRDEKQTHSPAEISDIVENTLSLIRTVIRRDQITLEVNVPDDLPKIKCRSQQIQQVLMNLLDNARYALNVKHPKFHTDKIVKVTVLEFDKDGRRWIRITVEDHGTGIPEHIKARLFDPFFTTKPRDKGTGLGLSISHGIVTDHHGELAFESEPGAFTRFHLDLPLNNGWSLEGKTESDH